MTCVLVFSVVSTHLSPLPGISVSPSQCVSFSSHTSLEACCCATPENMGIAHSDPTLPGCLADRMCLQHQLSQLAHHFQSFPLSFTSPPPSHSVPASGQPSMSKSCRLHCLCTGTPRRGWSWDSLVGISTGVFAVLENKLKKIQDTSPIFELITIKCQR